MRALLVLVGAMILGWLIEPGWLAAQGGAGQGGALARQSLRPYGHVFVAYALAWALVLGWVVSLGRRWSRVEDELGPESENGG